MSNENVDYTSYELANIVKQMPMRERITKGLGCCLEDMCYDCPYYEEGSLDCVHNIYRDTLMSLSKQYLDPSEFKREIIEYYKKLVDETNDLDPIYLIGSFDALNLVIKKLDKYI